MQQIFGGHGYIAEWGMEQFVRDARVAMLYEGANGVQALDLVGRSCCATAGRAPSVLRAGRRRMRDANASSHFIAAPLSEAMHEAREAALWLLSIGKRIPTTSAPRRPLHAAARRGRDRLDVAAAGEGRVPDADDPFCAAKLVTARHYALRTLPRRDAAAQGRGGSGGADGAPGRRIPPQLEPCSRQGQRAESSPLADRIFGRRSFRRSNASGVKHSAKTILALTVRSASPT